MVSSIEYSIHEITGPLGAEVLGFDPEKSLTSERFQPLMEAILAYQVLVFRDSPLTAGQQIGLSCHFGPLPLHYQTGYHDESNPEIFVISNFDSDGNKTPHNPDPTSSLWHIDGSWGRPRTSFTMLCGLEVPSVGGDTEFVNTYLAYDALPPQRRAYLEGLEAEHDLVWSVSTSNPFYDWTEKERQNAPVNRRPVVVPHTVTGRKAIYLGQHAAKIVGMNEEASRKLINEINDEAATPERIHAHKWRTGDVVIWDNRCTMHRSTPYDYANQRRLVHRTSMQDRI